MNITFNSILEIAQDEKYCDIVCYADDTLVIVTGRDLLRAQLRASLFIGRIINYIGQLGLSVATDKTEAIIFHPKRAKEFLKFIAINDVQIKFSPSIKYLGVMMDVNWTFKDHFKYIKEKIGCMIRALNRLMPNLKGPDEKRRRLFAGVVYSVILYETHVWGDVLATSRSRHVFAALKRSIAQRVISTYRTVSGDSALLLARTPPARLMAPMRKRIYWRLNESRNQGEYLY